MPKPPPPEVFALPAQSFRHLTAASLGSVKKPAPALIAIVTMVPS